MTLISPELYHTSIANLISVRSILSEHSLNHLYAASHFTCILQAVCLFSQAVARNATVGFFVMAPLLHGWYRLVARVCGTGPRTWKLSVKISAVEQVIFGPIVLTSYFTSTGKYSSGYSSNSLPIV